MVLRLLDHPLFDREGNWFRVVQGIDVERASNADAGNSFCPRTGKARFAARVFGADGEGGESLSTGKPIYQDGTCCPNVRDYLCGSLRTSAFSAIKALFKRRVRGG